MAEDGIGYLLVVDNRGQAIAAQQQRIAIEQANLVHVGDHFIATAAKGTRQDVLKAFHIRGSGSRFEQFLCQGMIVRNLFEFVGTPVVSTRITDVCNNRIPIGHIGTGPGSGHPGNAGMVAGIRQKRLLDQLGIVTHTTVDFIRIGIGKFHQPTGSLPCRFPDRANCQLTGEVPEPFAPRAIRHDQCVGFVPWQFHLVEIDIRSQNIARAFPADDGIVVFVSRSHQSLMRRGTILNNRVVGARYEELGFRSVGRARPIHGVCQIVFVL